MDEAQVTATFGARKGDPATLSKTSRRTIAALYQHPLSHNLEWTDVVALFEKLGTVEHKPHQDMNFAIAGEHHRITRPHRKDLTTAEVMQFRHMLSRAGWSPEAAPEQAPASGTAPVAKPAEHGTPGSGHS